MKSRSCSAILDVARSDVRAAAAFDSRWATLSSDMQSALVEFQKPMQDPPRSTSNRFFEVDRRVQDECSDAGREIGVLKP
jgi:hypothetical protein